MTQSAIDRWTAQFDACPPAPRPARALTFRNVLRGASRSAVVSCDDDKAYVIKGKHLLGGRVVCNEQIVGLLGRALGAPVPRVSVVNVPAELIQAEPQMQHLFPGLAHGSEFVPAVSEEERTILHATVPENRERFAKLAILYSWVVAGDHQLFYAIQAPQIVYSFDHGYFFKGGAWSITSLVMMEPVKRLDPFFDAVGFSRAELRSARLALDNVTEREIAMAVGMPPDGWGLTGDERLAMAEFLWLRRNELLAVI